MDTDKLVARLHMDGAVIVPDVLNPAELAEASDAFERLASARGKRWFNWEDIALEAEFAKLICAPRLMAVIDRFYEWQGEITTWANCSGVRDVYDPARPPAPFTVGDLRHGPLGWHDDVQGMKNPAAAIIPGTLATLLYFDDTFADNGAYCSATGSHHLGRRNAEGRALVAPRELVMDTCELVPMPLKAGSAIIHRAHEWHGVIPVKTRRRLFLQTFVGRATYDLQAGHTQLSDAERALIPADRHRYLTAYGKATGTA